MTSLLGPMPRRLEPEVLDALPADDADAIRSRSDLRRVNRVMGTRAIFVRALRALAPRRDAVRPIRILELGCGDGTLLLGVGRSLGAAYGPVELTLLDRLDLVEAATIERYRGLGWTARGVAADVFDWAGDATARSRVDGRLDVIVANLFLHHFGSDELVRLFRAVGDAGNAFFACEPRRAGLALVGSHLIGALHVNAVTRTDAVLSVHAGFRDRELTALWPRENGSWRLREYPAGLFSHCLQAVRVEGR
jgi:SAM-dependent methyltransferase